MLQSRLRPEAALAPASPEPWAPLAALPGLTQLALPLNDAPALPRELSALPGLRALSVYSFSREPLALAPLDRLPHLTALRLAVDQLARPAPLLLLRQLRRLEMRRSTALDWAGQRAFEQAGGGAEAGGWW